MSTKSSEEATLIADYNTIKDDLRKFGQLVGKILKEFCKSLPSKERVQIGPKYRLKDDKSLVDKAFNRGKQYISPLLQIQDKVGVRLVLLTMNDVNVISELIRTEKKRWTLVDKAQEISKIRLIEADRFSYQSNHFIVKPKRKYFKPTNAKIDYITCEIQVRTIMQHAYSEVSHDTVYKGDYVANKPMVRALATSMALIETSDEKFINVYELMSKDNSINNKLILNSIRVFKKIQPDFQENNFDIRSFHRVLDFIDKYIKPDDSFIELFLSFIDENIRLYNKIVTESKAALFSNPAIILVLFVLHYSYSSFSEQWPYSFFTLEESKRYLGL